MRKLAEVRSHRPFDDRITADPDVAMAFVPVLLWCDAAVPMLVAAAAITPTAALWLGRPGARPSP